MARNETRLGWVWLLLALTACSGDSGNGPLEVKWDRVPCERCRMVLSDRMHAAQVRIHPADGPSRVFFFDDLGCALVWLQEQPSRDDPATELWVTDWRDGQWIDAQSASYLPGQRTPMGYGLGAQATAAEGAMNLAQAREAILVREAGHHDHVVHGGADSEH